MVARRLRRLDDDFGSVYDAKRRDTLVKAMVLGPSIEDIDDNSHPGAILRKAILERCPDYGIVIWVMPEEKELIKAGKRKLRKSFNLCRYELELADECDVIIIVPASPGSYAELGFFAWQKGPCRKALILFHDEHKGEDSYLMQGPRKASFDRDATVRYVDYEDIERAWECVLDFVKEKADLKADETIGI